MADPSDRWKIGDLADLILGSSPGSAAPSTPPAAGPPRSPAEARPDPAAPGPTAPSRPRHEVLVLLNPQQDSVEAVSRYADYWSNRGENVGVFWMGQSGVKIGLFDCARRSGWSDEILHVLSQGPVESAPGLMGQFCDRLVAALVTAPGWTSSPLLAAVSSVCVIVEPAPYQLVGSYDSLKSLCRLSGRHVLSCFVVNTQSALEATRLGERFYRLGDQFLDRAVAFDGFSLAEKWPTTNRVAEAFVAEKADGRAARLRQAVLAVLGGQQAGDGAGPDSAARSQPAAASATTAVTEPAAYKSDGHTAGSVPAAPTGGLLPVVQVLQTSQPIADAAALDVFISERIAEMVPGALRSWPLRLVGDGSSRCRWVECAGGGRCIVVTTLGPACGALEQACAWLHPVCPDDHIMVLAPNLSSEQRRAAGALRPHTRLFELACLPGASPSPALLLRDVSGCC